MSTIPETISLLEQYNKWRRGDDTITMPEPFEVGVAIGDAVRLLNELEHIRSEFEKIALLCARKADSNVELRLRAEKAEAELAAAKKRIADCEFVMAHRYDIIERQEPRCNEANARAEKAEFDTARLDWLAVSDVWFDIPATEAFTPETMRDAIDKAMKEASK